MNKTIVFLVGGIFLFLPVILTTPNPAHAADISFLIGQNCNPNNVPPGGNACGNNPNLTCASFPVPNALPQHLCAAVDGTKALGQTCVSNTEGVCGGGATSCQNSKCVATCTTLTNNVDGTTQVKTVVCPVGQVCDQGNRACIDPNAPTTYNCQIPTPLGDGPTVTCPVGDTCDENGNCISPSSSVSTTKTIPPAASNKCGVDNPCPVGRTCNADGTCSVVPSTPPQNQATGQTVTLLNPLGQGATLNSLLTSILQIVIQVGSVFIILMLVYIGYKFVEAQGNPTAIAEARRMLYWTVLGALILLGSVAISQGIQATVAAFSAGH